MLSDPIRTCLVAVLIGHAWPAVAQTPPAGAPTAAPATHPMPPPIARPTTPTPQPKPEDAKVPVPPVQHRSALRGAPSAAPVPVESWSNANRVVDEVGGWRAYLKEAHGLPAPTERGK